MPVTDSPSGDSRTFARLPAISFFCVLVVLFLSGCADVSPQKSFGDVQKTVPQRLHWRNGSADDVEADAAVRELLSHELTADTAVQVALLNNRNLQATYEQLGIAQAHLARAGLLRNPVLNIDAKFVEGGGGTIVEMAFIQSISELLTMPQRQRAAKSEAEEARLHVVSGVLQLAGDVRRAVVDLQASEQLLEVRQTTLSATEASETLAQSLRDAGNITALNLNIERALGAHAKLDLSEAETQVAAARERLNALMGVSGSESQWRVAGRLPELPDQQPPLDEIESQAIDKSFALAAAKQQYSRASDAVGPARRNAILHDVEIGAAAEHDPDGKWAVGPALAVPVPLFDQGQTAAAISESELRAASARYSALKTETLAAARTAAQKIRSAREHTLYLKNVILPLRQEILSDTQKQNNAMQLGAFQLLHAKQDQINAGAQYVRSLHDYWLARIDVDQILAGAEPSSLTNHGGR